MNLKTISISVGAAWALCIFLSGIAASAGWCSGFVRVMAYIYIGYKPGFMGAITGAAWAFLDGAVFGLIIGFVYSGLSNAD